MSNLVDFLETIGSDATLRHAAPAHLHGAMQAANIDGAAQWAVMRGDCHRVQQILAAREHMVCLIMAPQAHAEASVEAAQDLAQAG